MNNQENGRLIFAFYSTPSGIIINLFVPIKKAKKSAVSLTQHPHIVVVLFRIH